MLLSWKLVKLPSGKPAMLASLAPLILSGPPSMLPSENHLITAHSRFRGSVNCGAPSMENKFQVVKFSYEVQKSSSLFSLVQNGPGSLGLPVLASESVLSGP